MKPYHSERKQWMYVLPLLHFVTGASKPYHPHALTDAGTNHTTNNWWGVNGIDLGNFKQSLNHTHRYVIVLLFSNICNNIGNACL